MFSRRPDIIYIHLADLLYPFEGKMTQEQYLIASRVIDINAYRKFGNEDLWGGYTFPWQKRLIELRTGNAMSSSETESRSRYFGQLIDFLDDFGLNPNIDVISMSSNPFVLSEGTHRIGYLCSLLKAGKANNIYIPVSIASKRPRFKLDGGKYYTERGISETEINELQQEFNRVFELAVPKICICGFIRTTLYTEEVERLIGDYGKVEFLHEISGSIIQENTSEYDKYIRYPSEKITVISFRPEKQSLYYSHGKVMSRTIQELSAKLSEKTCDRWGYIANTITESTKLCLYCHVDNKKRISK